MNPNHHINLFWSARDEAWIADVPDLRAYSAHGATPEQAVAQAQVAITLHLESLTEHGESIPEPRYRPAIHAARAA